MLDKPWYNVSAETFGNGALCFSSKSAVAPHNHILLWAKRPSLGGLASRRTSQQRRQPNGGRFAMSWEVDWGHPANNGSFVMARNPVGHLKSSRDWHLVSTGYLRDRGIATPTYRKDSWEVDWSQRSEKLVWARNPHSKMPSAREWHWVDFHTIERAGGKWKPTKTRDGRFISGRGYLCLSRRGMTEDEIGLADQHNLWLGAKRARCPEHRLVAVKKYGSLPPNTVVRHVNGCKTDNRPENLVLGTVEENNMDHDTARRMAMYWHEKYREAQQELEALRAALNRP